MQSPGNRQKTAGENSERDASRFESRHHLTKPFIDWQSICQGVDRGGIEALQQRKPGAVTLIKIDFTAHGLSGNVCDGLSDTGGGGQLVNDFTTDQRRVHIKNRQLIRLTARRSRLQRDIDFMPIREVAELRGKRLGVNRLDQQLVHGAVVRQRYRHWYSACFKDFGALGLRQVGYHGDIQRDTLRHHQDDHMCCIYHGRCPVEGDSGGSVSRQPQTRSLY